MWGPGRPPASPRSRYGGLRPQFLRFKLAGPGPAARQTARVQCAAPRARLGRWSKPPDSGRTGRSSQQPRQGSSCCAATLPLANWGTSGPGCQYGHDNRSELLPFAACCSSISDDGDNENPDDPANLESTDQVHDDKSQCRREWGQYLPVACLKLLIASKPTRFRSRAVIVRVSCHPLSPTLRLAGGPTTASRPQLCGGGSRGVHTPSTRALPTRGRRSPEAAVPFGGVDDPTSSSTAPSLMRCPTAKNVDIYRGSVPWEVAALGSW